MNQYEEFLEKIKKYFEYDEVVSEGAIINAYDLINVLKEKMSEIYFIVQDDKKLQKLFDDYYISKETFGKFFKKMRMGYRSKIDFILHEYKNDHVELYVRFNHATINKYGRMDLRICKDTDSDELYFGDDCDVDKEFVEYFQDLILANFQTIEEFYNLFKLNNPNITLLPSSERIEEEVYDDFLKIVITYYDHGVLKYNISIDEQADPNKIYTREWLNHESLKDFVDSHTEELLKKIPINILNLKETTQKIITDYYAKTNNQEQQLKLK